MIVRTPPPKPQPPASQSTVQPSNTLPAPSFGRAPSTSPIKSRIPSATNSTLNSPSKPRIPSSGSGSNFLPSASTSSLYNTTTTAAGKLPPPKPIRSAPASKPYEALAASQQSHIDELVKKSHALEATESRLQSELSTYQARLRIKEDEMKGLALCSTHIGVTFFSSNTYMSRYSPHPEGSGSNLPSTGIGEIASSPTTLQRPEVSRWATYVRSNPLQSKFPPNPDFFNDKTYSKHRYRSPTPIVPYTVSTSNTSGTHVPEFVQSLAWTYHQQYPQATVSTTRQGEILPIPPTDLAEERPVQSPHPPPHDFPHPPLHDDSTATSPAKDGADSLEVIQYEYKPDENTTVTKRDT